MRKWIIVSSLLAIIAVALYSLYDQTTRILDAKPSIVFITTPAPAPKPPAVPPDPVAPFDIRPVISLVGRFGMAHACPVSPTVALTNGHVTDPEPFSDAPLLPFRAWSAVEGDVRLISRSVSYAVDLSSMTPEQDGRLKFYFPIAVASPAVGSRVYWVGYDWRTRANMFNERVFSGKVLRVTAGVIVIDSGTTQGSSGSCVLDAQGRVVGIVAWKMDSDETKDDEVTVAVGIFGDWFKMPAEEMP